MPTFHEFTRGQEYTSPVYLPTTSDVVVQAVGDTSQSPPFLRGDDAVSADSWQTTATPNVYHVEWPHNLANDSDGNGVFRMWQGGSQIDNVASLAALESAPGKFFCPHDHSTQSTERPGAHNPIDIYYHAAGSTDPRSDGVSRTITARRSMVELADDCVVRGVRIGRCVHGNGGLRLGRRCLVEKCVLNGDFKHACVLGSGIIRKTWVGEVFKTSYSPAEPANGFIGWYDPTPAGLATLIDRCVIVGAETFAGQSGGDGMGSQWGAAITQHGSGAGVYDISHARGLILYHVRRPYALSAANTLMNGVFVYRCIEGVPSSGGGSPNRYKNLLCVLTGGVNNNSYAAANFSGSHFYEDLCVYSRAAFAALWNITYSGATLRLDNACIVCDPARVDGARIIFALQTAGLQVELNNCLLITSNEWVGGSQLAAAAFSGSRNIVIRVTPSAPGGTAPGFSTSTNLLVGTGTGHGFTTESQMLSLVDSIFYGSRNNPTLGDFRIDASALNQINGGVFPDGSPISNHVIGPRTHWDFRTHREAIGSPSSSPSVPVTRDQSYDWLRDFEHSQRYGDSARDTFGRQLTDINGNVVRVA